MNKQADQLVSEDSGEAGLADVVRLAGEEARRKKRAALSSHFQKIRSVVSAARMTKVKR